MRNAQRGIIATKPVRLGARNFEPQAQVPGHPSPIGKLTVEQGHILGLRRAPLRMYVQARFEEPITPGGTTHTVDLGAQGLAFAFTKRDAPAFPTSKHPDMRAYQRVSGAWQPANVTTADPAAGTVDLEVDATADAVRLYYIPIGGEIRLEVSAPVGSGRSVVQIANWTMRELAESAAYGPEQKIVPQSVYLIEDYAVQLTVDTKHTMAALDDELARHEIKLDAETGRAEYVPGGLKEAQARINALLGLGVSV